MKKITNEQLQTIVNYLCKRPYAEVAQLIQMLATLPFFGEEKKKK